MDKVWRRRCRRSSARNWASIQNVSPCDTETLKYSVRLRHVRVTQHGDVRWRCGACKPHAADKLRRIGAHLLQCDMSETRCEDGAVHGPTGSVAISEIAAIAHLRMHELPPGVEPLLDATETYQPGISTGVFSYATHGAVVSVDPETGVVELLDYAVAEDCGTMVNPTLVEGQIRGGVVQGIGTALNEELPYDAGGQPLAASFLDYHLPGAHELPMIRIGHLHTPATATEYGMKGMGEGGAVAPPAAIANAVRDALAPSGAEVNETPLTPERVLAAIRTAQSAKAGEGPIAVA